MDVDDVVFTDAAMVPMVRFPLLETVLRTIDNFDEPATGRSKLLDRDVFKRVMSAGEATTLFEAIRPIPMLPRLARRFKADVDSVFRTKNIDNNSINCVDFSVFACFSWHCN